MIVPWRVSEWDPCFWFLFAPPTGSDEHLNVAARPSNTCLDLEHKCMKPVREHWSPASQKPNKSHHCRRSRKAMMTHDDPMSVAKSHGSSNMAAAKINRQKSKKTPQESNPLLKNRIKGSFISSFRSSSWISPSHRIRLSMKKQRDSEWPPKKRPLSY